jgi:hypothetical protein
MDPLCTAPLGSFLNVDTQGRASAYLASDRVDYDVAIPGQTPRLYVDGAGLIGRSDQRWSDLRDFGGSLQNAINALPPDGGIVFVPRGTWLLSSGATVNKPNVTIMGEQAGTVIKAASPNSYDLITVTQTNFQLRDLTLDGNAPQPDSNGKCCLHINGLGVFLDATLQNVTITGGARYGLWVQDVHVFLAEACHFDSNQGSGACVEWLLIPNIDTAQFIACTFSGNGDRGCVAVTLAVLSFLGCTFDGNKGGTDVDHGNGLDALACSRVDVLSSFFTNPGTPQTPAQFLRLSGCQAAVVDGCRFEGGATAQKRPLQGVLFAASSSARLSSCAGNNLTNYLAVFDSQSLDSIELGNSEFAQPVPRIACQADAQRFVGMSRMSISAPCVATESDLPNDIQNVLPGALAWVKETKQLKIWNGALPWKTVTLTAPPNP